jgi:hypothetical protein
MQCSLQDAIKEFHNKNYCAILFVLGKCANKEQTLAMRGVCQPGNAYGEQCYAMEALFKAGHVLVIHIESRVICSKCETVYGQKNDHCKVISAEEQVAIIASLTTVVSATLHGLPLYLMANGGTDTNKSVESVKYKDSIDGKMIFFNYFFDSVHPRSMGCSSPQVYAFVLVDLSTNVKRIVVNMRSAHSSQYADGLLSIPQLTRS